MTLPTKNPIPSGNILDQVFNAEKIDEVVNSDNETYADRFGVSRLTMKGMSLLASIFENKVRSSTGYSVIGKFNSVGSLSASAGNNGDRVLVTGFYSGSDLGGGEFIFDSSSSSINDGVFCFNGWRRIFKNKIISTHDLGLIPGNNSDATNKLQTLLTNIPDGFTIEIRGRHCVSAPLSFRNKKSLVFVGLEGGCIDAQTLSSSFTFPLIDGWGYYAPVVGSSTGYVGGIISFLDCDGIKFKPGLTILGAKKRFDQISVDVTLRREYGDSGIQFRNSPNTKVDGVILKHFWAWGVYGSAGSDYSSVTDCQIEDTTMQSGINIWNGCHYCSANDNSIKNTALYGLEIETLGSSQTNYGPVLGIEATGNYISGAKWGVALVGGIKNGCITNNTIENCLYGFSAVKNLAYTERVIVSSNNINQCIWSAHVSSSQNIRITDNTITNVLKPAFVIANQYVTILAIDAARTTFTIFKSGHDLFPNSSISINGVSYTVTARQAIADANYTYGESAYATVTVSTALSSDVEVGDTVWFATDFYNPIGLATSILYTTDDSYLKGIVFSNNTVSGVFYSFTQIETVFTDLNNVALSFIGNKFIKTVNNTLSTSFRLARSIQWEKSIEWRDNEASYGLGFYLGVKSGPSNNIKPAETPRFSCVNLGLTAGKSFPKHSFTIDSDRVIIGAEIILYDVSSVTPIQLQLDGAVLYSTVAAASGTSTAVLTFKDRNVVQAIAASANGNTGRHTLQLTTSDTSAVCSGYDICLYLL